MAPNEDELIPAEDPHADFVPALIARTHEEAEGYCDLLNDHDIPAVIGDKAAQDAAGLADRRRGMTRGVPVLVPEVLLDEASEIIADREDDEEFRLEDDELAEDDEDDEFEYDEEEGADEELDEEGDEEDEDIFLEEDEEEDEDLGEDKEDL